MEYKAQNKAWRTWKDTAKVKKRHNKYLGDSSPLCVLPSI